MITLTKSRAIVSVGRDDLLRFRAETLDRRDWACLPRFVDASLLESFARRFEDIGFRSRHHDRIGGELALTDPQAGEALCLLLNDPVVLSFMEILTGSSPLGCFSGRVYRFAPGGACLHEWHDDVIEERRVAFTLNLSRDLYQGGALLLRSRRTGQTQAIENRGFGDALLFRVAADLEHRSEPVTGAVPKTAFAGWFRASPRFQDGLRNALAAR
mgnify:CR=1 FL=1